MRRSLRRSTNACDRISVIWLCSSRLNTAHTFTTQCLWSRKRERKMIEILNRSTTCWLTAATLCSWES